MWLYSAFHKPVANQIYNSQRHQKEASFASFTNE